MARHYKCGTVRKSKPVAPRFVRTGEYVTITTRFAVQVGDVILVRTGPDVYGEVYLVDGLVAEIAIVDASPRTRNRGATANA